MTQTHLEIERTYDLPDTADLPDLIGVGGILQVDHQEPFELDATYWDTARYDLVAARVTVRRRTGGHDAGWHIKRAESDTVRHEQHFPLTDDADTVPVEVLAALFTERRGRGLQPVVRITTTRTVTRLLDEDGDQIAELADDRVSAQRLDADAPADPRTWREVEVETVSGVDPQIAHEFLGSLDGRFQAVGAGPAAVASKLARGLAGAPAPRLQTADKPDKGTTARVITKRLRKLRSALLVQEARLRSGEDAELRETAATTLELAAILQTYRPAFPDGDVFDRAAAGAEDLAEVTARAALADHLVERLPRASSPAQDELVDAMTRERILAATRERRDEAVRDVVTALHGEPFLELLDALDDAVERPTPTPWSLRSPKKVAQDVTATVKPEVRELVRDAMADDTSDTAAAREAADRAATELAWQGTMSARLAMDVLGDDAFPHALWKRIGTAAEVLTERVRSLWALDALRTLSGIAERAGESTFAYGVLAGDRVRLAEESYDEAVHALNRV
ncbi:CYTH and CHAD domain-containing protein [Microbacterium sp. M1A1_1b]